MKLAGSRFDPKGDRLSPTAMEHLKQSFEACEAAAAAMLELGNRAGFAEAKLYLANGKRVAGERNKSASQIRDAIAAAEEAKDKLAAIDLPDLKAQTVLAKEGALSEPGAIERKPDMLREAKQLQLSTLPVYTGKDSAMQRTYAEVQLVQTLTDLAALEKTDENSTRPPICSPMRRSATRTAAPRWPPPMLHANLRRAKKSAPSWPRTSGSNPKPLPTAGVGAIANIGDPPYRAGTDFLLACCRLRP